jgi:hypothetical protein
VLIRHAMRDNAARDTAEHRVAGRMVAVMVRVEQHVDAAVVRSRLQPVEQGARFS